MARLALIPPPPLFHRCSVFSSLGPPLPRPGRSRSTCPCFTVPALSRYARSWSNTCAFSVWRSSGPDTFFFPPAFLIWQRREGSLARALPLVGVKQQRGNPVLNESWLDAFSRAYPPALLSPEPYNNQVSPQRKTFLFLLSRYVSFVPMFFRSPFPHPHWTPQQCSPDFPACVPGPTFSS